MRYPVLLVIAATALCSSGAQERQRPVASGRLTSNALNLSFDVTNEKNAGDVLTITVGQGLERKRVYRDAAGEYVYLAPVSEDESSFIVVWSGASGYKTKILAVATPRTGTTEIAVELNVMGKGFPTLLRAGAEQTPFVLVPNASGVGNVIDVVDIYALHHGRFKFEGRVPDRRSLASVQQVAADFDQAAAKDRLGTTVHP